MGHVDADGRARSREWVRHSLLGMGGGWTPSLHLFPPSRGKLRYDAATEAFLPGESAAAERSAGACRGVHGLEEALLDGAAAGSLGHSIALAMLADGWARQGETLFVQRAVEAMPVRVTGPVLLDPEGARLNA